MTVPNVLNQEVIKYEEIAYKIMVLLEERNKIKSKEDLNLLPFINTLNRDATIQELEDLIDTICIKGCNKPIEMKEYP
jgi:hypothetical protein